MSTDTTPPDPRDARLDKWISQNLASLAEGLDDILDVDAGLRDAQLPGRARSVDTALDAVLDIDAGLRAILPRNTQPQQAMLADDDLPVASTMLREYALSVARRSLHERLALRSAIPLDELRLVGVLANARIVSNALSRDPNRELNRARDLDRVLGRARARDLGDLNLNLNLARDLARALARDRDLARDLARDLGGVLVRVLARARALAHDRDLVRDLGGVLVRDLDRARDIARDHDLVVGVTELDAAVTDFTTADLTHLDLGGIDLRGVRWSTRTTRWPPGWVDTIRETSVQVDPDLNPELYEIRDDPRIPHTVL